MYEIPQVVTISPFNEVISRSPVIDELMKEYFQQQPKISSAAPSTSSAENDALISQLREQLIRDQQIILREKDKQQKEMREMYENQLASKDKFLQQQLQAKAQFLRAQLSAKDEQYQRQLDTKDKLLDLEKAEHQKTRNLLHQIKMELKDVELYYLRLHQQNESGQRRQREGEEEFKVKQEPGLE